MKAITGKSLLDRRKLLFENFTEVDGTFTFAKSIDTASVEDMQTFLDESIVGNCEGLM